MNDKHQELLLRLASKITTGYELIGSKWGKSEVETNALQAISRCANNLREHGESLTWQGANTFFGVLIDDGSLILEEYTGELSPPDQTVLAENGNPMVFRITKNLLYYAASVILKENEVVS